MLGLGEFADSLMFIMGFGDHHTGDESAQRVRKAKLMRYV